MEREKKIIKVSIYGIILNILLAISKAIIGLLVHSIAIVSDAINNTSDILSAVITIIGTKLASKKPDREHPYGHGRIEYFASIAISLLVIFAGVVAFKESVQKIISPEAAEYTTVSIIIISIAIVAKLVFGEYIKRTGKQLDSQNLVATGTDALMDAFLSLSTLIAAFISIIWKINLEGYFGLLISIVILKSGIELLRMPLTSLIGYRIDSELTDKIKERINSFKEVEGTYDLILHSYGPSTIIGSAHIQVDDNMTAKEIHKLSKMIQNSIYEELGIILTIGIYAANTSDDEFAKIKKDLEKIAKKYDEILQIHGFYVDTETNQISYDLIISFKCENPEKIKDEVESKIKEKHPKYSFVSIIDNDYSD